MTCAGSQAAVTAVWAASGVQDNSRHWRWPPELMQVLPAACELGGRSSYCGPTRILTCFPAVVPCLSGRPGLLLDPQVWRTAPCPPQAPFTQPQSQGVTPEAWASVPSPHLPHGGVDSCLSWGVPVGRSVSALRSLHLLLPWPPRLWSSLSLLVRGLPSVQKPFLFHSSLPEAQSHPESVLFLFFFLLPCPVIWRFSCPFGSLRSASVQ